MDKFEKIVGTITALVIAVIIGLATWACVECLNNENTETSTATDTIIVSSINSIISNNRIIF